MRMAGSPTIRRGIVRLMLAAGLLAATAGIAVTAPATPARAAAPASFLVGADAEDIAPTPAKMAEYVAAKNLYLGGYGIGSGTAQIGPLGTPIPCLPGAPLCLNPRYATGVMNGPHVFVRAVVVSDGTHTVALADLDTQGMFAAYRLNPANLAPRPYGIDDIRSEVARATNGGLAFNNITISGDHSHAGEDLIGVWGFVPDEYLAFIKGQAIKALETAYANRQPATIKEGGVPTPGPCASNRILNDQFDCNTPPNDIMDPELRTMQAVATGNGGRVAAGRTIMTLVNFAAHATVMGGGNTLLSPDWPGVVGQQVQDRYGGVGLTIVGAVGRSQPNRGDCTAADKTSGQYLVDPRQVDDSCRLSKYSAAVMAYVDAAVRAETPVTVGVVDGRDLFIHDAADNAGILAFNYAGDPVGVPVARAQTPPYLAGNVLGTWVGVYRIGDVVITTNPGEPYPNIRQQFLQAVPGARRYWTTGLSNDQLGYLIAPFPEGYPQAVQKGAGGNDNILFNISPTIGDHVFCTQVKGAVDMGLAGMSPAKCAAFAAEPNIYGPGGVDTGPTGASTPPASDFQGNPRPPVHAVGESSGGGLPPTGRQDPRAVAAMLLLAGAGAACAAWWRRLLRAAPRP
ncbi:MAG: hypothetical protein M3010_07195 [Candidatus Dormibacteraeota bacterium]|nr:hypothetical protein [Candidatus Dormibacteraeota bacterium]